MIRLIATTLMFYIPVVLQAQMNTDQPDQSTGASVLDKHNWQIESTVYVNRFKTEGTAVILSALARYGLTKKLEARLVVEQGYHRDLYIEEAAHATSPLALSAKLAMVKEGKVMPALSLMGCLQLPLTRFDHQPSYWSPALVLIMEKKLGDVTVTVNNGPRQESYAPDWEWQSTADLKLELNKKFEVFSEYFAQYQAHEAPLHNVDGGVLYAVSKKVQVHLAGGSSILHHPSNYFVNSGVAVHL